MAAAVIDFDKIFAEEIEKIFDGKMGTSLPPRPRLEIKQDADDEWWLYRDDRRMARIETVERILFGGCRKGPDLY